jgi:hypothetical protein
VPPAKREFCSSWEDHDDWGRAVGPDLTNMGRVHSGPHETSYKGLRLNRQEAGVRSHEQFIDGFVRRRAAAAQLSASPASLPIAWMNSKSSPGDR